VRAPREEKERNLQNSALIQKVEDLETSLVSACYFPTSRFRKKEEKLTEISSDL